MSRPDAYCTSAILLSACGKPDGISDAEYKTYKELGAPKILYSCTKTVLDDEKVFAQLKCAESPDCVQKIRAGDNKKEVVNVGYTAGVGVDATYNTILSEAKADCGRGDFNILDSKS